MAQRNQVGHRTSKGENTKYRRDEGKTWRETRLSRAEHSQDTGIFEGEHLTCRWEDARVGGCKGEQELTGRKQGLIKEPDGDRD